MSWVLFASGLALAILTIPALVPVHHWSLLFPAFFVSWLGTGFAGWWMLVGPLVLLLEASGGGLDGWPGWVGLAFGAAAVVALLYQRLLARRCAGVFDRALAPLDRETRRRARRRAISVLAPFWMGHRAVDRIRDLRYAEGAGRRHLLDVYRPRPPVERAPVLLQIHGGAWMIGSKNSQGGPIMQAMASAGWVCVSINYRLSPRATWPDHLLDCKLAMRWIRENIAGHGGDPHRVVVTGGSAGAHLAAMLALTANDPEYQPGFEEIDTSVVGCVPMYGPYALDEIFGRASWSRLGRRVGGHMGALVLGANVADDPAAYRDASPIQAVQPGAPPFLVVHGTIDNLVPVEQARNFATALREMGTEVTYVELPGAPHAFDIFHSEWADSAVSGVARWLSWLLARDVAQSAGADSAASGPKTMARTAPQ